MSWDTPHGAQIPVRTGSSGHPHWLPSGLFPSISLPASTAKSVFSVFSRLPSALPFQQGWRCGWRRKSREASLPPDGPLKAEESETMSHSPTSILIDSRTDERTQSHLRNLGVAPGGGESSGFPTPTCSGGMSPATLRNAAVWFHVEGGTA